MKRNSLGIALLALSLLLPNIAGAKRYKFRIATIAPKGSTWVNIMEKMRREVRRKTKGQVRFKFYTGGRMGDEKLVVRKMKAGSLHGAAVTSIGLVQIVPSVLVLQLPGLFRNYKELDYVREKLDAKFREKFRQKGFVLLGWGDLGYVYLYSKRKINSVNSLRHAKIWGWTDDPLTRKYAQVAGVTPHLLGLLDVRASLQTGAIDTVAGTPLAIIAMQWHPYLKYRIKFRFAIGIAATVVTKKSFDRLPANLQKTVLAISRKYHRKLIKAVRRDNRRAKRVLRRKGIKGIKLSRKEKRNIRRIARKTRQKFIGKLYSKQDLDDIIKLLRQYRKNHKRR